MSPLTLILPLVSLALLIISLAVDVTFIGLEGGLGLFLLVCIGFALLVCGLTEKVISRFFDRNAMFLRIIRNILIVAGLIFVLLCSYFFFYTLYIRYVAPRAIIELPSNFKGKFELKIKNIIEPSIKTSGEIYLYKIPLNGKAIYDTGWIYLSHSNPDNYAADEYPPLLSLGIRFEGGRWLHFKEYSCDYIYNSINNIQQDGIKGVKCSIGENKNEPSR